MWTIRVYRVMPQCTDSLGTYFVLGEFFFLHFLGVVQGSSKGQLVMQSGTNQWGLQVHGDAVLL